MIQIIPTLFATSEEEYKKRIEKVNSSGQFNEGWVQIDLMDNKFVQNLSITPQVVKKYPLQYKKEIQLMVVDPKEWIDNLLDFDIQRFIFPIEIDKNISELINYVKSNNIEVGISLNPETEASKLEPYINALDAVLLMGVTPGLEGQTLAPQTAEKIKEIKRKWKVLVGVDGGIKDVNAKQLVDAGADYLAIGSFLFEGDIDENVEKIWEVIQS